LDGCKSNLIQAKAQPFQDSAACDATVLVNYCSNRHPAFNAMSTSVQSATVERKTVGAANPAVGIAPGSPMRMYWALAIGATLRSARSAKPMAGCGMRMYLMSADGLKNCKKV
jgi:hypothetical protein